MIVIFLILFFFIEYWKDNRDENIVTVYSNENKNAIIIMKYMVILDIFELKIICRVIILRKNVGDGGIPDIKDIAQVNWLFWDIILFFIIVNPEFKIIMLIME